MECDICGRIPGPKRQFHCTTCARSAIYPLRIEHALVLLDKETMGHRLESVVQSEGNAPRENISLSGAIIDTAECSKTYHLEKIQSEAIILNERADIVAGKAEGLKQEMEKLQKEIAASKTVLSQRKSEFEAASYGIRDRSSKELEVVQAAARYTKRRWDLEHDEMVKCKAILCREAASLAGLRMTRHIENHKKRDKFTIGTGTPIFDLRELNSAPPDALTSSLTQLAYVIHQASTYLGIRLPAEMTLPHRDYPLATIFKPDHSYRDRDVPFPGYTPFQSSVNSPAGSRMLDPRPLPHPRPLYVHRELPKLFKEDVNSFSLFVEGVTLLAWNVAWLCKTQGISGFTSWTDICPVGRNLYQLLAMSPKQVFTRIASSSGRTNRVVGLKEAATSSTQDGPTLIGQFSHSTAHSFGATEGSEMMRNWRLQNPQRAWDKVRSYLVAEMQGAEWEVVQVKEWDNEGSLAEEEPVLVGGRKWALTNGRTIAGKAAPDTTASKPPPAENSNEVVKVRGANGWTKLRSRSGEHSEQ